jgi:hypothetical protein
VGDDLVELLLADLHAAEATQAGGGLVN